MLRNNLTVGYDSVSVRLWFRVWAGRFKDVTLHRKTLSYIVKRYATLQDIALRCKMLRYAVRRSLFVEIYMYCIVWRCLFVRLPR